MGATALGKCSRAWPQTRRLRARRSTAWAWLAFEIPTTSAPACTTLHGRAGRMRRIALDQCQSRDGAVGWTKENLLTRVDIEPFGLRPNGVTPIRGLIEPPESRLMEPRDSRQNRASRFAAE